VIKPRSSFEDARLSARYEWSGRISRLNGPLRNKFSCPAVLNAEDKAGLKIKTRPLNLWRRGIRVMNIYMRKKRAARDSEITPDGEEGRGQSRPSHPTEKLEAPLITSHYHVHARASARSRLRADFVRKFEFTVGFNDAPSHAASREFMHATSPSPDSYTGGRTGRARGDAGRLPPPAGQRRRPLVIRSGTIDASCFVSRLLLSEDAGEDSRRLHGRYPYREFAEARICATRQMKLATR